MAASALIQGPHRRRGEGTRHRGAGQHRPTVPDVVRILLTRVAREGALPPGLTVNEEAHDAWFRAKVQEALDDPRLALSHEEVEAHFARRRAAARRKV